MYRMTSRGLGADRHFRDILSSFDRYQAGEIDIERLQSNVAIYLGAMERDVPKEVLHALDEAVQQLEYIRFMVDVPDEVEAVANVRQKLNKVITHHGLART